MIWRNRPKNWPRCEHCGVCHPDPCPSPAEINERAEVIRGTWPDHVKAARKGLDRYEDYSWQAPTVGENIFFCGAVNEHH